MIRSAAAPAAACPDSQHSKIAAAWCSQVDSVTAEPLAKITIGRTPAAASASISASWLAGRSMWVRSKPSDSAEPGRPRQTTT